MLVDEIRRRIAQAMKSQKNVEKEILRLALGEIQLAEARGVATTDENIAAVLRKIVKSNEETSSFATDPAQKKALAEENAVLLSLLPQTLTAAEIVEALAPIAEQIRGAANDGQATGIAMKRLKGDGASVSGKEVAVAVKQIRG